MSIPVDLDDLSGQLDEFGPAFLVTTDGERCKVVSVLALLAEGVLRIDGPGRGSCANVEANPTVTVLWPPYTARDEEPSHSLIVDGTAVLDGDAVLVTPTSAVLHSPVGSGPEEPGDQE